MRQTRASPVSARLGLSWYPSNQNCPNTVSAWKHRDFILYHCGRCLVELGAIDEARDAFEQALVVRVSKGNPYYIASTRRALAVLADGDPGPD